MLVILPVAFMSSFLRPAAILLALALTALPVSRSEEAPNEARPTEVKDPHVTNDTLPTLPGNAFERLLEMTGTEKDTPGDLTKNAQDLIRATTEATEEDIDKIRTGEGNEVLAAEARDKLNERAKNWVDASDDVYAGAKKLRNAAEETLEHVILAHEELSTLAKGLHLTSANLMPIKTWQIRPTAVSGEAYGDDYHGDEGGGGWLSGIMGGNKGPGWHPKSLHVYQTGEDGEAGAAVDRIPLIRSRDDLLGAQWMLSPTPAEHQHVRLVLLDHNHMPTHFEVEFPFADAQQVNSADQKIMHMFSDDEDWQKFINKEDPEHKELLNKIFQHTLRESKMSQDEKKILMADKDALLHTDPRQRELIFAQYLQEKQMGLYKKECLENFEDLGDKEENAKAIVKCRENEKKGDLLSDLNDFGLQGWYEVELNWLKEYARLFNALKDGGSVDAQGKDIKGLKTKHEGRFRDHYSDTEWEAVLAEQAREKRSAAGHHREGV